MASAIIRRLQLLVVFLCATVCCAQEPSVVVTYNDLPGVVNIIEGKNIELLCKVKNLNSKFVTWFKVSDPITPDEKYQLTANETTGMYILTILNLTRMTDTATYFCTVFDMEGDPPSNYIFRGSITVQVLYFPEAGNPKCYGQTVMEEGVTQEFQCQSQPGEPDVVVEWRRDLGVIEDGSTASGTFENGTKYIDYAILPKQADFGVNLTCKITSTGFPEIKQSCTVGPLVIQFRPSDVAITNTTYSQDNTTYMYDALSCNATANPPDISYSWNFNTLLDSSQQLVTDDNQTLVILNVTSCETTIIATCIAVNAIGTGAVNFTLCEPLPPTTTEVTTTEVTTLRDTTTEITASGITASSPPLATDPPTTTKANGAVTEPQGGLTPALYAVICCGAFIILLLFIGVACFVVKRGSNKDEDEDETVEKAFQQKSIRALSIALIDIDDDDDEHGEMRMTNLNFVEEVSEKEQEGLEKIKNAEGNPYVNTILHVASDDVMTKENQKESPTVHTTSYDKSNETTYENIEGKPNSDNDKPEEAEGDGIDDDHHDDDNHVNQRHDDGDDGTTDSKDEDDNELMVSLPVEDEAQDVRKSLVHEALLAVQVDNSNTDSLARAGHKATQETEIG